MATGGEEVDSRITCSVCLEPYRGRQAKILPCFHTFCVPCLAGLMRRRENIQTSDTPGLDADKEEGRSADSLTCPTCRRIIPVPTGGVTAFQTNFYLDSSSREEDGQPVPCTVCDGDQTAQFHCGQCQNSFCPQCRRAHNKFCQRSQVRALQRPSSSSSGTAQNPTHCQVRQQLQKVEGALKKLTEEEKKLNQERQAMDDSISIRYATLLRHAADARDTCCLSLREVCDGLMERLHSSMAEARQTQDTLQQQLSSSQPAPVSASQLRAALFLEGELPMILSRDLDSCSLLQYHMEDNTSLMVDDLHSFMGKVARPSQSSGPAQSQAPSGSLCLQDGDGAMPSAGADPKILNDLSKKVEDLAGQVTLLQSMNTQLSQHVTLLSNANSKLSTEQSALLREMTTLKDRNVQLTTEQAGLQREVTAVRDKHAIVHQDLAVLRAEKDKVSAQLGKLQKDVISLQTDTSKQTTDIVQLKADHGDVVTKFSSVQSDIAALQGEGTSMKKDIAALQGEGTSMKKDIAALQGEGTSMKKDIAALQGEGTSMKKDIKALQGDGTSMKKDIIALQGDGTIMKDIAALQGDGAGMKKDVDQLKIDCSGLKSDMAKIQGNLNNLESRFGIPGMPPSQMWQSPPNQTTASVGMSSHPITGHAAVSPITSSQPPHPYTPRVNHPPTTIQAGPAQACYREYATNKHNAPTAIQQGVTTQAPPHSMQVTPEQKLFMASMLAAKPRQEQKQILSECLFPLIKCLNSDLAGKITSMLLEADNSEVMQMLECQEFLKAKVEEAVAMLQAHNFKEAAAAATKKK